MSVGGLGWEYCGNSNKLCHCDPVPVPNNFLSVSRYGGEWKTGKESGGRTGGHFLPDPKGSPGCSGDDAVEYLGIVLVSWYEPWRLGMRAVHLPDSEAKKIKRGKLSAHQPVQLHLVNSAYLGTTNCLQPATCRRPKGGILLFP